MGRGRLATHVDSFGRVRHSGDGHICPSYVALARPLSHREKPHPSRMTFAQRDNKSRISRTEAPHAGLLAETTLPVGPPSGEGGYTAMLQTRQIEFNIP